MGPPDHSTTQTTPVPYLQRRVFDPRRWRHGNLEGGSGGRGNSLSLTGILRTTVLRYRYRYGIDKLRNFVTLGGGTIETQKTQGDNVLTLATNLVSLVSYNES